MSGWGSGAWGSCPWGVCSFPDLTIVDAQAVSENVIRVTFSTLVYFSDLLDASDASIPSKYTVTPVAGTIGLDGTPARAVSVVMVTPSPVPQDVAAPSVLDLTLDRPMTAFPAQYTLAIANIYTADLGRLIDPLGSTLNVYATFKQIAPPTLEQRHASRDFANPQTQSAMLDPLPNPNNPLNLGVFSVDDTGDYAFDEGLVAYKKRILRRLFTNTSAFAHLPGYGVGVASHGKRLATSAILKSLTADAEKQIAQEPETESVTVTFTMDPNNLGLVRFSIIAQPKGVSKPLRLSVRLSTV